MNQHIVKDKHKSMDTKKLATYIKDWGAIIGAGMTICVFIVGFMQANSSRTAQIAALGENYKVVAATQTRTAEDITAIKSSLAGYQALQLQMSAIEKRATEDRERINRLEAGDARSQTLLSSLKTTSEMELHMLDGLSSDLKEIRVKIVGLGVKY